MLDSTRFQDVDYPESMRRPKGIRRVAAALGIAVVLAACATDKTDHQAPPSTSEAGVLSESTTEAPAPETPSPEIKVPLEHTVTATTYWIGEGATADNAYISNVPSAWDSNTVRTFGGVDTPDGRTFTPLHNTYYFALPAGEFTESGLIPGAREASPWANEAAGLPDNASLFKGRWIQVNRGETTIYAQWHDVGPNEEQDYGYVFGHAAPANTFGEHAGLDLSPDASADLALHGSGHVSWQFVDAADVPPGPWTAYPAIDNTTRW